jgi:hypothetical protein
MPEIVFQLKDASGNDASGATVSIDGAPVSGGADGKALEVDPGEHVFRFEAAGHAAVERRLVIHEGGKDRTERVVLPASVSASTQPSPPPTVTPPPAEAGESGGGLGAMRWGGVAAGAVGVVGLGIGIGSGLAATSKHSTLQGECPGSVCPPTSKNEDDLNSFHLLRTTSTIGYVIGAGGLIGGGALFLFGRPSKREATGVTLKPWIGAGSAGVAGAF